MNAPEQAPATDDIEARMNEVLRAQRDDYMKEGVVSAETRIDRLERGIDAILKYQDKIVAALNEDFGCRPREVSLLTVSSSTPSATRRRLCSSLRRLFAAPALRGRVIFVFWVFLRLRMMIFCKIPGNPLRKNGRDK